MVWYAMPVLRALTATRTEKCPNPFEDCGGSPSAQSLGWSLGSRDGGFDVVGLV